MNWTHLKRQLRGMQLSHKLADPTTKNSASAPSTTQSTNEPTGERSPAWIQVDASAFWSGPSLDGIAARARRERRSQRIQAWRRSALLRKGARLYSSMLAKADVAALGMLDHGGMVVSWYEPIGSETKDERRMVDNHISQFYLATDLAIGVPVRDLCSAAIHGTCIQSGWRRYPDGVPFWATTIIERVLLRDGRLQGFSFLIRRSPAPRQDVGVARPRLPRRSWRLSAIKWSSPRRAAVAAVAALLTVGAANAAGTARDSLPEYAYKRNHGSGWECLRGYRRNDDRCEAVQVPAHAYLEASGSGWKCDRGYVSERNACVRVQMPANAYLDDSYATGWQCSRGYREVKGACAAIQIPANAHADESPYGDGWVCDRGFRSSAAACVKVLVPANGYLTREGDDWKCGRGFTKETASCNAIQVPTNAYLDVRGNGWACERGFSKHDSGCQPLQVPTNAHLNYSGESWRCDGGFRREQSNCVRE